MPIIAESGVDLALAHASGWWHRRGLRDSDFDMVRATYHEDEYRLKHVRAASGAQVVIDAGAAIGTFARLAHELNATARIFAVEANPLNIEVLRRNVGRFATVIEAALTYEPEPVGLLDSIYPGTTASGGSVVKRCGEVAAYAGDQYIPRARPLATLTLERLRAQFHVDRIDILKLDVEGSEHSILEHATCLDSVRLIVGEYHGGRHRWERLVARRFKPRGWRCFSWNHHDHMGLFWLANRAVAESEISAVAALDHDYGNPAADFAWEPFGEGMRICRARGLAYQVDRSKTVDYGAEYFNKYLAYEGTPIALQLCDARNALVGKYCRCLIDVGIGSGEFIKRAKVKCYGYDVNPQGIEWLEAREIYVDPYECIPPDVEGFSLWDVLEHLPNPSALLNRLSPGMFLFVSIPIWETLETVRGSKHFRPNEHYWYFTDQGLKGFLADHDFRCLESNDIETRIGREVIRSYVFQKGPPPARRAAVFEAVAEAPGNGTAKRADAAPRKMLEARRASLPADRVYTVEKLGGYDRVLHVVAPAGIGDISWVYSKLSHFRAKYGIEVLISCPGDDEPKRGGDFVQLLPEVKWGGYLPGIDSWRVLCQCLPSDWPPNRETLDMLHRPWPQSISANLHLESGRKLADFLPRLPTDYHYPIAVPNAEIERAKSLVDELEHPRIAVYVSNRDKEKHKRDGWALWDGAQWASFLEKVAETPECAGACFVFLGAEYDRDKTEFVADELERAGRRVARCIGKPLGVAVECLRRCRYFFSFPSGIGVLGNVLQIPGVMLLPWTLKAMEDSFADPIDIERGRFKAWAAPSPERVLEWFRHVGVHQAF